MRPYESREPTDQSVQALAAQTPRDRNRVVDLVRVLALTVVVFGHWVMQGLWVTEAGTLRRVGLLQVTEWAHPLTWGLQVMPLFFLVGGYVNALSWRRSSERGVDYGQWLTSRTKRLVLPLLPLLAFWTAAVLVADDLGLGRDWVRIAGKAAMVPTWFVAVYLVVVALTPMTLAWWRRWRIWSVVTGVVLAGVVDVVSLQLGRDVGLAVGAINMLVVWATVHQLGYAWRDGVLGATAGRGRGLALTCVGLVGAGVLVYLGPYGVSMVGVSGFGVDNSTPPRVTLLFVGLAQVGAVMMLEPALARVARVPRIWQFTVLTGSRMMTIYLWHLTAFGLLAAVSLWFGGLGMSALPMTSDWWWSRPAWFVVLGIVTLGLVAIFGRVEQRGARTSGERRAVWPLLETLAVCYFVGVLAMEGLIDSSGQPTWGRPAVALLVLGLLIWQLEPRPDRPSVG